MLVYMTILVSFLFPSLVDSADVGKGISLDSAPNSVWMHVKCHKGVDMYERLVKINELQVRQRRGELIVDCDFDAVSKFLTTPQNMKLWMKGVKKANCMKSESKNKWYIHTVYRLPWPFNNKEMISAFEFKRYATEKCVIHIQSIDSLMDVKSHKRSIRNLRGNWLITRIDDRTTKIVFTLVCATPPMFPRWIQDPIIKSIFFKNMIRMKKQLSNLSGNKLYRFY